MIKTINLSCQNLAYISFSLCQHHLSKMKAISLTFDTTFRKPDLYPYGGQIGGYKIKFILFSF